MAISLENKSEESNNLRVQKLFWGCKIIFMHLSKFQDVYCYVFLIFFKTWLNCDETL